MAMMFRGFGARPDVQWGGGGDLVDAADRGATPSPLLVPQPPKPAPSFFDEGGTGRTIAGFVGDALLKLGGQAPVFAPAMQAQRQRQQQIEDHSRRQSEELAQWRMQQDYKAAHPDDQFTQYITASGIDPRSAQGQALYRQRAETMATPPTVAVDGFDSQGNPTKTFMPRTGFPGAQGSSAPPGPAPGMVKNGYRYSGGNPNDRNNWVPVGGASPSGGATFR